MKLIRQWFGWWTRQWGLDQVVVFTIICGAAWWALAC